MQAMNNKKGQLATKPVVPEPSHGTPPDQQTLLPLTPPATADWHATVGHKSPASVALELLRQRQYCAVPGVIKRLKLPHEEYDKFIEAVENSERLKDFVDNKVRYVGNS